MVRRGDAVGFIKQNGLEDKARHWCRLLQSRWNREILFGDSQAVSTLTPGKRPRAADQPAHLYRSRLRGFGVAGDRAFLVFSHNRQPNLRCSVQQAAPRGWSDAKVQQPQLSRPRRRPY